MKAKQIIIKNNEHFRNSLVNTINNNNKEIYSYLNTYTFYLSNKNSNFKKYLENANYIRIGGVGTKIYFKLLFNLNVDKVTFSHFFLRFGGNKFFSNNKYSIYCLGGTEQVSNELTAIFAREKINLIGSHNGYFSEQESENIITQINLLKPQILLVGLGTPFSDFWTFTNKDKLPNCAIIHVGNTFDLLTNRKQIGPSFLFNSGFEWIFRLIQEPRRLFTRYMKSNLYLAFHIVQTLYKSK